MGPRGLPYALGRCMRWCLLLSVLVFGACAGVLGPTAERRACLTECAKANDACILEAGDASQVQACDRGNRGCIEACPP